MQPTYPASAPNKIKVFDLPGFPAGFTVRRVILAEKAPTHIWYLYYRDRMVCWHAYPDRLGKDDPSMAEAAVQRLRDAAQSHGAT